MLAPGHQETAPRRYLPSVLCGRLYELAEIAEAFSESSLLLCFHAPSTVSDYQIMNTDEHGTLCAAVEHIKEQAEIHPANRGVDIRWCQAHLEIVKATQDMPSLVGDNAENAVMIGNERLLHTALVAPKSDIFHQFNAMAKLSSEISASLCAYFSTKSLSSIAIEP